MREDRISIPDVFIEFSQSEQQRESNVRKECSRSRREGGGKRRRRDSGTYGENNVRPSTCITGNPEG
jgi:hypothetical protein